MWIKKMWRKIKQTVVTVWDKLEWQFARFVAWCLRNWDLFLILFAGAVAIIKEALKLRRAKLDEDYRNRRFYDRRTDRWCYANKHLNKKEQNIIESRYQDGETYRSILNDMGLLK